MPSLQIDERTSWIFIGVFTAFALYKTYSQLDSFKRRCEVKPEPKRDNINQATEDGRLTDDDVDEDAEANEEPEIETLGTLARGVNFDLRNAALRIIAERSLNPEIFSGVLAQVRSTDPNIRLKGLMILRYLSTCSLIEPVPRICTLPTHRALITALHHTLDHPTTDRSNRLLYKTLSRFLDFSRDLSIQAGIIDFFARKPELIHAYYEPDKYELLDMNLVHVITSLLYDSREGKQLMEKKGLLPEREVVEGHSMRFWDAHYSMLHSDGGNDSNAVFPLGLTS